MFEVRNLYLHENCRDAAIMILNIYTVNELDVELLVSWWNVGTCHDPEPMNIYEEIKVKRSDIDKWKAIPTKTYRSTPLETKLFSVTGQSGS